MEVFNAISKNLYPEFWDVLLEEIFIATQLHTSLKLTKSKLDSVAGQEMVEKNRQSFLKSRQAEAKNLWESFRSNTVIVDYSTPWVQIAYLIRYFPQYCEVTLKALEDYRPLLNLDQTQQRHAEILLFGSGPCPEIIAILLYILKNKIKIQKITFKTLDINQEWEFSRSITNQIAYHIIDKLSVLNLGFDLDFRIEPVLFDFRETSHWNKPEVTDAKPSLILFQNFINEIVSPQFSSEDFSKILINGLFMIKRNFPILIIDQSNLNAIKITKKSIKSSLDNQGISCSQIAYIEMKSGLALSMPEIITSNLLLKKTSGLIPRINLDFSVLSIDWNNDQTSIPTPSVVEILAEQIKALQADVQSLGIQILGIATDTTHQQQQIKALLDSKSSERLASQYNLNHQQQINNSLQEKIDQTLAQIHHLQERTQLQVQQVEALSTPEETNEKLSLVQSTAETELLHKLIKSLQREVRDLQTQRNQEVSQMQRKMQRQFTYFMVGLIAAVILNFLR